MVLVRFGWWRNFIGRHHRRGALERLAGASLPVLYANAVQHPNGPNDPNVCNVTVTR